MNPIDETVKMAACKVPQSKTMLMEGAVDYLDSTARIIEKLIADISGQDNPPPPPTNPAQLSLSDMLVETPERIHKIASSIEEMLAQLRSILL